MTLAMSSGLHRIEPPWLTPKRPVMVGKDVLELLSSSMYVDPMSIYREYVQNSTDAIDEARATEILEPHVSGVIEIQIDDAARVLRIRDNGVGVDGDSFYSRLTAFGASKKRNSAARGFRGVGRLAGIGYCQELIFRSRAAGEGRVSELRWDCRNVKSVLRAPDYAGDLNSLVNDTVQARQISGHGWPEHFFEVELKGIIRHRNDLLLNPQAVERYLSQVAPVPFASSFRFGRQIVERLGEYLRPGDLHIQVGKGSRILRPHRDQFEIGAKVVDTFRDIEFLKIPSVDGEGAAVGWILHHGYRGAIPAMAGLRGLRIRTGNMQIGRDDILEDLFPEPRFNAWAVGEIHVLDSRTVPNGRRDHFEQNVHFDNLLNHLAPIARSISQKCRASSTRRNRLRQFERLKVEARHNLSIVRQGSLSRARRVELLREVEEAIAEIERVVRHESFREFSKRCAPIVRRLRVNLAQLSKHHRMAGSMQRYSKAKRRAYEHLFSLVYECSPDKSAAKVLIDRILSRLC